MRIKTTIMVEKRITTWSCDHDDCDFSTTRNAGYSGQCPIMPCTFCDKDCCGDHRLGFWENGWDSYYHDLMLCMECSPRGELAWEHAKEIAGRYDDLGAITKEIFDNWDKYKDEIEGEL